MVTVTVVILRRPTIAFGFVCATLLTARGSYGKHSDDSFFSECMYSVLSTTAVQYRLWNLCPLAPSL
jgi:hypothetical protein